MDERRAAELRRKMGRDPRNPESHLAFLELQLHGGGRSPLYDVDGLAKVVAEGNVELSHNLGDFIAESEHDWFAWKVLEYCIGAVRRRGCPVRGPLLGWALDVAQGCRKRPTRKPGRDRRDNLDRDFFIFSTVEAIQRGCGIPATSETSEDSACHMVARRANLRYERVRQIWREFPRAVGLLTPGDG